MSVRSSDPDKARQSVQPLPGIVRGFHWVTAALLALMFALAWTFDWIGPSDVGVALVDLHRSFGILLFVVAVARLAWRASHPLDPSPHDAPRWERLLASGVQAALYLCLLAMPLLGWSASALSGETIRAFGFVLPDVLPMNEDRSDRLFELHGALAWILLGLIVLHVAGALRHQFVERDGLMNRMRVW